MPTYVVKPAGGIPTLRVITSKPGPRLPVIEDKTTQSGDAVSVSVAAD